MQGDLITAISTAGGVRVDGVFYIYRTGTRQALTGSRIGGRWHPPDSFPAFYMASSRDSAIVEVYRRIVEASDPPLPASDITVLVTRYAVAVDNVLDLRSSASQTSVGLSDEDMRSPIGKYTACQRVGAIAHQCGYHGIIAPAASGVGDHLTVFEQQIDPASEWPSELDSERLEGLPPHPRRLRLVDEEEA